MSEKRSYITLLSTNEYIVGTLALNESLKNVKSKYKLVVLVNDNISVETKTILINNDIEFIETKTFEVPRWMIEKNKIGISNWSYTFDKLAIFELTQYDKLVYLDSDMFVRKNIDKLFDMPNMTATVDRHDTVLPVDNYQKLTSGILIIKPEEGMMNKFIEIINNELIEDNYKNIGDQDIIQLYDQEWGRKKELHLSVSYNMFFPNIEYYINNGIYSLDEINIIHFICTSKPWTYDIKEIKNKYLDYLEENVKETYEKTKREEFKDDMEFGRKNKEIIVEEYSEILYKVKNKM